MNRILRMITFAFIPSKLNLKQILVVASLFVFAGELQAQRYRTAAGFRLGSSFGLSVQQKIFEQSTLEGIFQAPLRSTDDTKFTFLYEEHKKLIGKRINFYYGAGVHKGWAASADNPDPAGLSLIAGIELSFDRLNISMDYKPAFNVISGVRFFESQNAMTLRYIIVKQKKKKINWKFWKKKD